MPDPAFSSYVMDLSMASAEITDRATVLLGRHVIRKDGDVLEAKKITPDYPKHMARVKELIRRMDESVSKIELCLRDG
jgi:hypothetical protein